MARDFYEKLTHSALSVTGTAAVLNTQVDHHKRTATLVQNHGTDILYIGGPGVTTAAGVRLAANEHITIEGPAPVYGISVGTSSVRVIEFE